MQKNILVVTPTLGNRSTLKRTVESVRKIGGNQVKHIIIAPSKAIPTLQKEYTDIECIPEPDNCKGIYPALNYVFNQYGHNYEYLTFINDDDYWLPSYNNLIQTIKTNPQLDLVYGRTRYVDENNSIIGTQTSSFQFNSIIPLIKNGIILITQQATIIKSNIYFQVNGFDESYQLIADTKFWLDASKLKLKYKYINKECAAYMYQEGQLSSNKMISRKEHERLSKEYTANYFDSKWQTIVFRIINSHIYFKRFIHSNNFKNPFSKGYTS